MYNIYDQQTKKSFVKGTLVTTLKTNSSEAKTNDQEEKNPSVRRNYLKFDLAVFRCHSSSNRNKITKIGWVLLLIINCAFIRKLIVFYTIMCDLIINVFYHASAFYLNRMIH